jgi:HTH-type transcriptional regulator/antitoxin HigA
MVKVIKTDAEHQDALTEIRRLMALDPDPNTPDGDKLELLALLVEEYESKRYPFELPDPIDAILFRMEQQGLRQRDLVPYFGSRSKVSEVLHRKRPLTLAMIRCLHAGLGLPAHVLIQKSIRPENTPVKENMGEPT